MSGDQVNHVTRFQQEINPSEQVLRIDQLRRAVARDDDGFRVFRGSVNRFDNRLGQRQIGVPEYPPALNGAFKKHLRSFGFGGFLALAKSGLIGCLCLFPSLIMADATGEEEEAES